MERAMAVGDTLYYKGTSQVLSSIFAPVLKNGMNFHTVVAGTQTIYDYAFAFVQLSVGIPVGAAGVYVVSQ